MDVRKSCSCDGLINDMVAQSQCHPGNVSPPWKVSGIAHDQVLAVRAKFTGSRNTHKVDRQRQNHGPR